MDLLLIFFMNCIVLSSLPGPNNILCFNYTLRKGALYSMIVCLGRFPSYLILMCISGFLLFFAIGIDGNILNSAQVIGSFYIIYLGTKILLTVTPENELKHTSNKSYFLQEFWVALSNPKAILVFLAIFPNFIDQTNNFFLQFLLLGSLAMLAELLMAYSYILLASLLPKRSVFIQSINKVSGAALVVIACLMLFKTFVKSDFMSFS
ncbi:LysE family translocator [Marinomonas agarivorans]|nr:LysE family translocator [Marinomonas agarivorans]